MRASFLAAALVLVALGSSPSLAAKPPPKPVPKPADAASVDNNRADLFEPPPDAMLGVPPPSAGLIPSAEDFLNSGRGLSGDEGDPAYGA